MIGVQLDVAIHYVYYIYICYVHILGISSNEIRDMLNNNE